MHPNLVQELAVSDCGAELILQSGFATLLKLSFWLAGHLLNVPSAGGAIEKTAVGWVGTKRRSTFLASVTFGARVYSCEM